MESYLSLLDLRCCRFSDLNNISNPANMHLQSEISILTFQWNISCEVAYLQYDLSYHIHTEK